MSTMLNGGATPVGRPPQPLMSSYTSLSSSPSSSSFHRRSQSASMLDKLSSPKGSSLSISKSTKQRSESPASSSSEAPQSPLARDASLPPARTEVWFWGRGSRGQAGQGDMLDRLQPCQVSDLSDRQVRCIFLLKTEKTSHKCVCAYC